MSAYLLDVNGLITLAVAEHEHHELVSDRLADAGDFTLCPITEGSLVRFLVRMGEAPTTAIALLTGFHQHP